MMNREDGIALAGSVSRRNFLGAASAGALLLGVSGAVAARAGAQAGGTAHAATVVADPTAIPAPIRRRHSVHHDITLEAKEVRAKLADGTEFGFMTWNGQIPGPMIRVRVGAAIRCSCE